MQFSQPRLGGWRDGEGRTAAQIDHRTRKAEAAVGELVGKACIRSAQIGWRKQQVLRDRCAVAPAQQGRAVHAGNRTPPRSLEKQ